MPAWSVGRGNVRRRRQRHKPIDESSSSGTAPTALPDRRRLAAHLKMRPLVGNSATLSVASDGPQRSTAAAAAPTAAPSARPMGDAAAAAQGAFCGCSCCARATTSARAGRAGRAAGRAELGRAGRWAGASEACMAATAGACTTPIGHVLIGRRSSRAVPDVASCCAAPCIAACHLCAQRSCLCGVSTVSGRAGGALSSP